jgi:hypothetical protein
VSNIRAAAHRAMIQLKHQRLVIQSELNNQQIDFGEMLLIHALFIEGCHSINLVRPKMERSLPLNPEPEILILTTSF